jgi:hypothetical protein
MRGRRKTVMIPTLEALLGHVRAIKELIWQ